tara:strand:- start:10252 stop:10863 length:612 start_codon:yes stop_codon:yes gene_type:complete
MDIYLVIFFSYISGSIPFGLILSKFSGNIDIRKIGSGNIGATNVLRTGNKLIALLTLLLDILKGYVPVIIAIKYFPNFVHLSCLAAFLGHLFPVWLKFKGGKGIATYIGILIALSIQLFFLFIFTWLIISLIFKYSSLSSMIASVTVFVVNLIREIFTSINPSITSNQITDSKLLFIFLILIIFTHRRNILNLKNKTEQKIKI